jgi:adenosylcobinamide kinase / adenosylcobinamide-phosphate guanylyltransferase
MGLTLLLGGARSGKSALALRRARHTARPLLFVATATAGDAEMAARIERHRAERRGERWTIVEEPLDLARALAEAPVDSCVVVDCLSLWVANLMQDGAGEKQIAGCAAEAARRASLRAGPTIAVSNEVGLGVVPAHELGRRYRDALGRVNSLWAGLADEAALVVAGRPLALGGGDDG